MCSILLALLQILNKRRTNAWNSSCCDNRPEPYYAVEVVSEVYKNHFIVDAAQPLELFRSMLSLRQEEFVGEVLIYMAARSMHMYTVLINLLSSRNQNSEQVLALHFQDR